MSYKSHSIQRTLTSFGITPANVAIADRAYVLPTRRWVKGRFAKSWSQFVDQHNIRRWRAEKGDCDNSAQGAMFWAGVCFLNTKKTPEAALLFGEFWIISRTAFAAFRNKKTSIAVIKGAQAVREIIQNTKEGKKLDAKIKQTLIEHQSIAGVVAEVGKLLNRYIPNHKTKGA